MSDQRVDARSRAAPHDRSGVHRRRSARASPYFTNTDRPVFALTNLPETVKGALFARYSRSAKSLRRLFLDEFLGEMPIGDRAEPRPAVGAERADKLYARVLNEYGDDSVAQLGGAHIACEGVSNVLTKVLEWGRLMAYLEQSTRYVPVHRPAERPLEISRARRSSTGRRCAARFVRTMDAAFETYARWIPAMRGALPREVSEGAGGFRRRVPLGDPRQGARHAARPAAGGDDSRTSACSAPARRSKRCCCGCARIRSKKSARAREQMLAELRQVIPAFLARVDQPDRGGRWSEYLAEHARRASTRASGADPSTGRRAGAARRGHAHRLRSRRRNQGRRGGALRRVAICPTISCWRSRGGCPPTIARRCCAPTSATAATAVTSPAAPSSARAIASTCSTDYGAFRDLQRHRLLTLEWQPLSTPPRLHRAGGDRGSRRARRLARGDGRIGGALRSARRSRGLRDRRAYAVVMAYRVRFYMDMNAREAMHVIELRTAPQGHPVVPPCLPADAPRDRRRAGHRAIAAAMQFADHSRSGTGTAAVRAGLEKKRTVRVAQARLPTRRGQP